MINKENSIKNYIRGHFVPYKIIDKVTSAKQNFKRVFERKVLGIESNQTPSPMKRQKNYVHFSIQTFPNSIYPEQPTSLDTLTVLAFKGSHQVKPRESTKRHYFPDGVSCLMMFLHLHHFPQLPERELNFPARHPSSPSNL